MSIPTGDLREARQSFLEIVVLLVTGVTCRYSNAHGPTNTSRRPKEQDRDTDTMPDSSGGRA